jgi:PEP-CTERM motif
MQWTLYGRLLLFAGIATQFASATTIIQSLGNSGGAEPLGYYAPYGSAEVAAAGWTQTSTYTNIDVAVSLLTPPGNSIIDYTLVTAIGPGTSFAQDGIVQGSVTVPYTYGSVDLFQLPSLGPGTYFLVLDSPSNNTTWLYNYPIGANYVKDAGVSLVGNYVVLGSGIDNTYTPASSFTGYGFPTEFSVTGTLVPAPEPATLGLFGLSLIGVAVVTKRVRNVKHKAQA